MGFDGAEHYIVKRTENNMNYRILSINQDILDKLSDTSELKAFLLKINEEMPEIQKEHRYMDYEDECWGQLDCARVVGYIMHEDFKLNIAGEICDDLDFDTMEKYICEIGIRKSYKMAKEAGVFDASDFEEFDLSTGEGIKMLFVSVLHAMLNIADGAKKYEDEFFHEVFAE